MLVALLAIVAFADESKPPAKPMPSVIMTSPLVLARGQKTKLIVRGLHLDNCTEVHAAANGAELDLKILSKGKAGLPANTKAELLGDTQVEIELEPPGDLPADRMQLAVTTPDGTTQSREVRLYDSSELTMEKEPNGGFSQAQKLELPTLIVGSIAPEKDVDVFRVAAKKGQTLSAEVLARRLGSGLDSLLTIYDAHGHALLTNDDTDTPDSRIDLPIPADGDYFIALTDANMHGGDTCPYLMEVKLR